MQGGLEQTVVGIESIAGRW